MMIDTGLVYEPSAGETFDVAALAIYGDESYIYLLLMANPEHCHKIHFEGDEVLLVPEREEPVASDQLPWKED
ncbi:MAG: hypothetical protein ACOX63_09765 [Christensenellales bacterium]|jgi:hypothetical protein